MPGKLVKTERAGPHPQSFQFSRFGVGLRTDVSNVPRHDDDDGGGGGVGLGPLFENHWTRVAVIRHVGLRTLSHS